MTLISQQYTVKLQPFCIFEHSQSIFSHFRHSNILFLAPIIFWISSELLLFTYLFYIYIYIFVFFYFNFCVGTQKWVTTIVMHIRYLTLRIQNPLTDMSSHIVE